MSIRIKLAVILALAIGTTTIIAASIFISQQRHSLQISEEEKVSLLMENVKTMARESVLARDPLMLIDYLRFLSRDRREVLDARASVNGVWQGHSPPAEKPDPNARIERVTILNDSGTQKIVVEVVLSRAVLESRLKHVQQAMATNLIRAALGVVLGGIVLSFPLGWTLTSRLVEIEKVMKEVGEGHLDKEVFDSGSDEVARLARGLNAMTAHLRELAEMKRTFIASVTHELRSPLFAIESYVKQLLRESTRLNDEDRNRLERVQANASRLAAFVTSLLDMAKIERGQLEYKPKQTDVVKLVEDVVEFQRSRAGELGLTLVYNAESNLPLMLVDPDLINQVVTNLLSNAIKFTPRGGQIEVSLKRQPLFIECAISDTGPGIPAETLTRLFRPFERGADPLRAGGTGLGLSIAKSIIERHAGHIGVDSEPGRGSRFYFTIPFLDNNSLIPKPS